MCFAQLIVSVVDAGKLRGVTRALPLHESIHDAIEALEQSITSAELPAPAAEPYSAEGKGVATGGAALSPRTPAFG